MSDSRMKLLSYLGVASLMIGVLVIIALVIIVHGRYIP